MNKYHLETSPREAQRLLPLAKVWQAVLVLLIFCSSAPAVRAAIGMQQFTADGHVVGFAPGYTVFAGGSHALKVEFVGANAVQPRSAMGAKRDDKIAPPLSEVAYPGLWQGIELIYRSTPTGIAESVYRLEPRADVSRIRLVYSRPFQIEADGSLTIVFDAGKLSESAPVAWQERDGRRFPVSVAFAAHSERELGFRLGEYDPTRAVWIDPILSWSTFLGGSGSDRGLALAADLAGNLFVAGQSSASWGSAVRPFAGGGTDAFVAKLDANGGLLWNTFLGGASGDIAYALSVDAGGNVYVAGGSSSSWGSPVRPYSGTGNYAFAAKVDGNGNLLWNTFLGGGAGDSGFALSVDTLGDVYVAGFSNGSWGSPVRPYSGGGDAFTARLDRDGNLLWNTFLGGDTGFASGDGARSLVLGAGGNVYVAGYSYSIWGSPLRAHAGNVDAFAAKLDANGNLLWNTFLGGNGAESAYALVEAADGNVYVAGDSWGTWGSPVRGFSGGVSDGFVAMLDANGNLRWNSFLGGNSWDRAYALTVDAARNVYVAGYGYSTWGNPVRPFTGSAADGFVAMLDGNGNLLDNTFLGSAARDLAQALALGAGGNVYVAGYSSDTWGSPLQGHSGGEYDAFVSALAVAIGPGSNLEPVPAFSGLGRILLAALLVLAGLLSLPLCRSKRV